MNNKQDIINTLLACMDYNKKDDTWYIKANRIDNLAKDLESEFNNVDLADVSQRSKLLKVEDSERSFDEYLEKYFKEPTTELVYRALHNSKQVMTEKDIIKMYKQAHRLK